MDDEVLSELERQELRQFERYLAAHPSPLLDVPAAAAAAAPGTAANNASGGSVAPTEDGGSAAATANAATTAVCASERRRRAAAADPSVACYGGAALPVHVLPDAQYLEATIVPLLIRALEELAAARPPDPLAFLGAYLLTNNPQRAAEPLLHNADGRKVPLAELAARAAAHFDPATRPENAPARAAATAGIAALPSSSAGAAGEEL